MQGLGSVKRKKKRTISGAKKKAKRKPHKRRASVSGIGAIAGAKPRPKHRRRRRRSSLGRVKASTRRHKRHARGLGSITGGNKYVNAAIKVAEIAGGMLLSAAATTAFFKNADPEKDKKMKKLRGPVAVVAGLALSFLMKNPHLENIGVGIAAHGVLRAIGDLILVDKKDKLGLGITDDSMHGNDTVGELSLFGDPASLFGTELLFGDPASLFGYPEMGELPLASPEDRFSGYQVGAGELTPMQGLSGPFEEVYARANGKYVQRLNGVIASLSN
jgi:hypothetical protein